jgi:hypothetical protein
MLYIHHSACVSPQQTFPVADIGVLHESVGNKLLAKEPPYPGIPENILRRMGKAVRMGVGTAIPLLQTGIKPAGIIIGTANGGMEDCIKFLNQIIEYDEGILTPTNFVQSTPNAIAGQIGLLAASRSYNITHVHRGLSFENALLDGIMKARENPEDSFLLGAVDEISSYNFNIDFLAGWYKEEAISNKHLYASETPASIAGEGSVMFLVNNKNGDSALAAIPAIEFFHTDDMALVEIRMKGFLENNFSGPEEIDLLITGENGDSRLEVLYSRAEDLMPETTPIARFKHMSGEYPSASSFAVWLSVQLLQSQQIPAHILKRAGHNTVIKTVFIYNSYKGEQHSLIKITLPSAELGSAAHIYSSDDTV